MASLHDRAEQGSLAKLPGSLILVLPDPEFG
jgi:hypothetical protein